jgi:hypothetical protein
MKFSCPLVLLLSTPFLTLCVASRQRAHDPWLGILWPATTHDLLTLCSRHQLWFYLWVTLGLVCRRLSPNNPESILQVRVWTISGCPWLSPFPSSVGYLVVKVDLPFPRLLCTSPIPPFLNCCQKQASALSRLDALRPPEASTAFNFWINSRLFLVRSMSNSSVDNQFCTSLVRVPVLSGSGPYYLVSGSRLHSLRTVRCFGLQWQTKAASRADSLYDHVRRSLTRRLRTSSINPICMTGKGIFRHTCCPVTDNNDVPTR